MDIVELLDLDFVDPEVVSNSLSSRDTRLELLGKSLIKSFIVGAYLSPDWSSEFQHTLRDASISSYDESQLLRTSLLRTGICGSSSIPYAECLTIFRQLVGSIYQAMEGQWKRYQILSDWFKHTMLDPVSGLHQRPLLR